MKRILLLVGVPLLGGCATLPPTEAKLDSYVVCDAEFIAKVEREARLRGTSVRWMRCPQLSPGRLPPYHYGERRDA